MDLIEFAETGFVPDRLVRMGIRRLLSKRLAANRSLNGRQRGEALLDFVDQLRASPLAVATDAANEQHYEVTAEFFERMLGPRLKYSACLFDEPTTPLADAEARMLGVTCDRADIQNGMRVLELGCGWGSLTLWMAEHFPDCQITAVSNSASQRRFIESRAADQGSSNIQVITADMRDFELDARFDRVVSVEMFEHMRNYERLFEKVSNWLTPEGQAFVHVFCHRETPYLFETEGADNWMGRHFFTGGTMPSEQLFGQFDRDLTLVRQWRVGGMHYWRTCEHWLTNLDQNRAEILARFGQDLSAREAKRNLQRWRMFLMACAELFRFQGGDEWFVAHYSFVPSRESPPTATLAEPAGFGERHSP